MEYNHKSSLQEIVESLRKGQKWLTVEFREWRNGKEYSDKELRLFNAGIAKWEQMDRLFQTTEPRACIWGMNKKCPNDAPIVCFACETPTIDGS